MSSESVTEDPRWLLIARELQAIAQAGLTFSKDSFDQLRFQRVREIAAIIMADGTGTDSARILELFNQEVGYPTPKVDVRGAVFVDGKVLMVREASDGRWTLPGGWADVNQSAAECVAREIFEESGFEARVLKLAAALDYGKHPHSPRHPTSIYKLFFLCELTGGAARPSNETTDIDFFALEALPELSGGRITAAQIQRMFEHARQPNLPTDFD